ncbi:MAG TPA: cytochrome c biogenesis CcdA family protein [Acidimicrobiales bacterium]|jgi:cytochrome c-type biogenesis protein|nr:cytochrome c biogenesis CcdA family protein [Acidimicrobiales bacterium]
MLLSSVQNSVLHGSALLAVPIAFAAGLVSFFSPCVLPLVPGYVAFLGGATGVEAVAPARRRRPGRALAGAMAFVVGFSFVYVSLGTIFGGIGESFRTHERVLQLVFGSVTILFGLLFAGWLPSSSLLNREARVHWLPSATVGGAGILGVLFGVGWSPCIGPALGAILALSSTTPGATAWRGSLLTAVYCLGLGVPFLVAAVAADTMASVSKFARRHTVLLLRVGGLLLIAIGVLEVTGTWATFVEWLQRHLTSNFTPAL